MKQKHTISLFYKRVKDLAKLRGQSLNCVERNLGYPRNALNNYKHVDCPSGKRLLELSQYFGVSPEYLIDEIPPPSLSETPGSYFNQLTDQEKHQMFIISQTWLLETFQNVLLQAKEK